MLFHPKFYHAAENYFFLKVPVQVLATCDRDLVRAISSVALFWRAEETLVKDPDAELTIEACSRRLLSQDYNPSWRPVLEGCTDLEEQSILFYLLEYAEREYPGDDFDYSLYRSDGELLMASLASRVAAMASEQDSDERIAETVSSVVFRQAPQRWDGRRLQEFITCRSACSEWSDWDGELAKGIQSLRFGQNPMRLAAFYSLLGVANWNEGGFVGAAPCDSVGDNPVGKWSLFYLMYWETLDYSFDRMFNGRFAGAEHAPCELSAVRARVIQELCGVRSGKWILSTPYYPGHSCDFYLRSMKESDWIGSYVVGPAQTLALSFKANGYAEMMVREDGESNKDQAVLEFVRRTVGPGFVNELNPDFIPEDDWRCRFLMFLLARYLFHYQESAGDIPKCKTVFSRLFALLYLKYYRKGPDVSQFTRDRFASDWRKIPFSEKEAYAEKCRRLLVQTRNEVADRLPIGTKHDVGIPSILLEIAAEAGVVCEASLFRQHASATELFPRVIFASLCHSKSSYEAALRLVDGNQSARITHLTFRQILLAAGALMKYPIDELPWFYETLRSLLPPEVGVDPVLKAVPLWKILDEPERVEWLLNFGVSPDQGDVFNSDCMPGSASPLYSAVELGDGDLVRLLLRHGANPNTSSIYSSAIASAVQSGRIDIVKQLVEAGGDINVNANIKGKHYLPLRIALDMGDAVMVRMLVLLGADPGRVELGEFVYQNPVDLKTFPADIQALFKKKGNAARNHVD